jgi:hypothetical protein
MKDKRDYWFLTLAALAAAGWAVLGLFVFALVKFAGA